MSTASPNDELSAELSGLVARLSAEVARCEGMLRTMPGLPQDFVATVEKYNITATALIVATCQTRMRLRQEGKS